MAKIVGQQFKSISDFSFGTIDTIPPQSIPDGSASNSVGWLTKGSKIELSLGRVRLGTENTGTGKITGLGVTRNVAGLDILFRTRGQKMEIYDETLATPAWTEIGTNILGSAADGEDVSFAAYYGLAGPQMWASSPNSDLFKIAAANPGTAVKQYTSAKNFKGFIKINQQHRMILWNRGSDSANKTANDKYGLYFSQIDKQRYSDFTQTTAESVGTGDGTKKTFTATLAQVTGVKTAFSVQVTDTSENFIDNRDGTLTGSLGGTGTINYATGALSVTFKTAPANNQAITTNYYAEDSTVGGIADFTPFSGTRTAGQGIQLMHSGGGQCQNVASFNNIEYCFHEFKTWGITLINAILTSGTDDTKFINNPFRVKVGTGNWRAMVESEDGVYYIDDTDKNDVHLRLLNPANGISDLTPQSVSKRIEINGNKEGVNFNNYKFNAGWMVEFGDYIVFGGRTQDSTPNDTLWTYNKKLKVIDRFAVWASVAVVYRGTLLVGDSNSNNVYQIFTGVDDDGAIIFNSWEGNFSKLKIERLKKCKELWIRGEIGADQKCKVSLSLDRATYGEVGGSDSGGTHTFAIQGNGTYVDRNQSVALGAQDIGLGAIGGSGLTIAGVTAFNFEKKIQINSDEFQEIRIKFECQNIGYMSISEINYKDIRQKALKVPPRYRL